MGVRHVATSPYHPETNGATERLNSTLLPYLRSFAEHDPDHWFWYLGAAQFAYNTSFQTSLAATPYFLLYGRDPVDTVDQTVEALLGEDQPQPTLDQWSQRLETARHLAQRHLIAVQEASAARQNRSRHEAVDIQEGAWVFVKHRQERKAKLDAFGVGLYQVVNRRGNALDLRSQDGDERKANISDVTLIRNPPEGCVMDPYQILRALLHQHAVTPARHHPGQGPTNPDVLVTESPVSPWDSTYDATTDFDAEDTPASVERLQPRRVHFPEPLDGGGLPPKDKMEEDEEMQPIDQQKPHAGGLRHVVPEQQQLQHTEPERSEPLENRLQLAPGVPPTQPRTANRICDVAVRDRMLYVKIGYEGVHDSGDDLSWFFFKDLAEPDKRSWLRTFVRDNVAGIRDSGWKSLPGLLAAAGAPLPVLKKRSVLARPNTGGDCYAQSTARPPLAVSNSNSGASDSFESATSPRTDQ
jgi:hypothetical protein